MDEQQAQKIFDLFERWGTQSEELGDIFAKTEKSTEKFRKEINKLTEDAKKQKATYAEMKSKMDELDDAIEDASKANNEAKKVQLQKIKADLAAEAATKQLTEATRKATSEMLGRAAQGIGQFVKNLQGDSSGTQLATDIMTAGIDIAGSAAKGVGKTLNAFGDAAMAAGVATEGLGFIVGGAAKILGTALDAGSEAMTKLAKFGVEILSKEVEKTYKSFNQMSASGALFTDGMTGMRNAAGDAGLTVEQMSNVVKASSEKIAAAGLGMTEGTKMIGRVGKALKDSGAQEQLMKLGYGIEEQSTLIADVTKQMRITGKTITDKEVQGATQKYAENLRLIASITGEDAKKKMAVAEEASKELAFRQELAKKSPEQQAAIQQAMTSMSDLELKNFKDRVVFHGAVVNQQGALYEAQVKGAKDKANELYKAWGDNTLTYKKGAELNSQYGEQINKSILGLKGIATAGYAGEEDMKGFSESLTKQIDANNQYTKTAVAGAEAGLDQKDAHDDLTKGVIGAEQAAQKLKVALQEDLTPAIQDFARVSTAMLKSVENMLDDMGYGPNSPKMSAADKDKVAAARGQKTAFGTEMHAGQSDETVLRGIKQADWLKSQGITRSPGGVYIGPNGENLGILYENIKGAPKFDRGGSLSRGGIGIAGERGPELISGPSSVLSTASTANLVRAVSAMNEMSSSGTSRMGVLRERMRGFEGISASQLQSDPIVGAGSASTGSSRSDHDGGLGEANSYLSQLVRLMKQNVDHTSRVVANTN